MENEERTIKTNYTTAVNWLHNSLILYNEITKIDDSIWDNCRFNFDEIDDIYQFYLTDCTESDVQYLESHFGLLFTYSGLLDLFVLCVDHYGTRWDCVDCYTDLETAKI